MSRTGQPSAAESREALERLVDEQAALRRVAVLVAQGVPPGEIFAAVSDEVGRLIGTDSAAVVKYDDSGDGISYVGSASKVSGAFPLGVHWKFQDGMASFEVYRTGRSARSGAHLIRVEGPIGDTHRRMGIVSAVASPIVVEGRLWGAMAVHGQEPLPPDTEERVEKFTELVATAIANAESRLALTRLAEEQAALRRVATLVADGVRPDEIFAAVSNEIGRLVGTDSATVMKFQDDGSGILFVGVASKMGGAFPLGAHWKFVEGMASREVYRTGRSARSGPRDWSKVEGPVGETHHQLGIASAVASPIVVDGGLWGAMAVQSQAQLPLGTEERLEKFTELVATAIANAESRESLARLADEQAALRRVATLVALGVPPEDVFAAVTEEIGRLLAVDLTTMCRYEPDGTFAILAASGLKRERLPVGSRWAVGGHNLGTLVFETGRAARIDNLADATGQLAANIREEGVRSAVASPIVVEGRLWGLMTAASSQERPLPADTEQRVSSFTELVATALANTEAHKEVGRLVDEQAALRCVATLVAEGAAPAEVFQTVTREVGILCGADLARMERYDSDDSVIGVAGWTRGDIPELAVGTRFALEGVSVAAMVRESIRPVRVDSFADAHGPIAHEAQSLGIRSSVGCPIVVDGRLWGVIAASSKSTTPFPRDTESQIAEFTELVATAIANTEARTELTESRARIVAASDDERRRVVRDLHDGAQQRLVHTILTLKQVQGSLENGGQDVPGLVAEALSNAQQATAELRELAHGILPAVVARGGLRAGVDGLASRMPVPVEIDVLEDRLPKDIEATAYFVIAEALTNVAKHARAAHVDVAARIENGTLQVQVRDDGAGGAVRGSGLVGLADRLATLDGSLRVESPADGGTLVGAAIPIPADSGLG